MISKNFDLQLQDPCGRMVCGPDWGRAREDSLRLVDAELWLVWRGRGWMRSRDRIFDLLPGFCALMRPGGIYDAGHDEAQPLGITFIHFNAWRTDSPRKKWPLPYGQWPEFFEVPDLDFYDSSLRRIVQLFPRQPDIAADLLKTTLLDLLLSDPRSAEASAITTEQRRKITHMVVSVHAETGRLPHVIEMARALHWSPAHFSRIFKSVTQQSPLDFIIEVRLSRARQLLAETSLTVGAIAERLDYQDIYFFSRQFKVKTGLSPLQYRKRLLSRSVR